MYVPGGLTDDRAVVQIMANNNADHMASLGHSTIYNNNWSVKTIWKPLTARNM